MKQKQKSKPLTQGGPRTKVRDLRGVPGSAPAPRIHACGDAAADGLSSVAREHHLG